MAQKLRAIMGHIRLFAPKALFPPSLGSTIPALEPLAECRLRYSKTAVHYFLKNIDHAFAGEWTFQSCQMPVHYCFAFATIDSRKFPGKDFHQSFPQGIKVTAFVTQQVGQPMISMIVKFIDGRTI